MKINLNEALEEACALIGRLTLEKALLEKNAIFPEQMGAPDVQEQES